MAEVCDTANCYGRGVGDIYFWGVGTNMLAAGPSAMSVKPWLPAPFLANAFVGLIKFIELIVKLFFVSGASKRCVQEHVWQGEKQRGPDRGGAHRGEK
ncbi:hypothetical protein NDU88_005491 [Pleurodeles waltl]|uniref:Uncharacterized protein n=1 Tax=Pleurodeles waltl TaxID=8319 RepID=A0AAV7L2K2_PLEWA|nr:hypothetical protein NDU88_005491 [Pleurodeles waltl]